MHINADLKAYWLFCELLTTGLIFLVETSFFLVFSLSLLLFLVRDTHRQMVCHTAPWFDHLDLRNAMVPFMMVPCDGIAGAKGVMSHQ